MVSELIFQIYDKTQILKKEKKMSLLIKIYSNVFLIRKILSRYITRRMFGRLSRAIGTFNSFENILGGGPNPKQRQRNS